MPKISPFRRTHLIVAATVFVVASGCTSLAFAKGEFVTAELAASSPPVRSGAPITVVWKINSQSTAVLPGRLELTVRDGTERMARLIGDDVVLAPGEQIQRMVLPPLNVENAYGAVEMHLRFVGADRTIDLGGQHPLRLPGPWQRQFVVAVSDPWESNLNPERQALLQQFRFEKYNVDSTDHTITTLPSHVRPDELPADPLGYCGYDLVLLMYEGFAELKEAQCQALLQWVDAGGSVCVVPGRSTPLKNHHLKFLSELTPGAPPDAYQLDPTGRLALPDDDASNAPQKLLLARRGLGRVAVVRDERGLLAESSPGELRRMLAFLWRLRRDRVPDFMATGRWNAGPKPDLPENDDDAAQADWSRQRQQAIDEMRRMRPRDFQLSPIALQTGDQLLTQLMPRNLRVVPLKLIGLILFVYVLAIGPGDYLLLGALRRRRYTWFLFPAVTVGFAMGTVWLSNWYMRITDNRRGVSFLDVGDDGRIARRNRFEVLFEGTQGTVATQVTRGLLTAMNHQRFSAETAWQYNQAAQRGMADQFQMVAVPDYAGRVPARYQVTQYLPQWTPQLNRLLTLSTDEQNVDFDWSSLAGLRVSDGVSPVTAEASRTIVEKVRTAFGPQAAIFIAQGQALHTLAGTTLLHQRVDPRMYDQPYPQPVYGPASQLSTFLQDVCAPWMQGGLFNVVSQISPTGGKDFEDLALLDPSDGRQWVLIVVVEQADELIVYRKLYSGGP